MRKLVAALTLIGCAAPAEAQASQCAMSPDDRVWIENSLRAWEVVRKERLHLPGGFRPIIVVFDARCRFEARSGTPPAWHGEPHSGTIALPYGGAIPAGVTSFASGDEGKQPFFVMALPSVWRDAKIPSVLGREAGLQAVFLHEYMHAQQTLYLKPVFARLNRFNPPDDISDDSLQAKFKGDPDYVAAYEKELGLLQAAADEPDSARARQLARDALAAMRARQARWFTGDNAMWKVADDLFLTMEGIGQWSGYSWLSHPKGWGLSPELAERTMRGSGKWWSQEQGLALFLVIDRLLPGWQGKAFRDEPMLGIDLLAEAASAPDARLASGVTLRD